MGGKFEYTPAEEIRDAFARHGNTGAILLGYPDTTQDADLFVEKSSENGRAMVHALAELGFQLTDPQADEIVRGKDFVQLKNGPFDLYLISAPDGIERFEDAYRRRVEVEGFPVCHPSDIIASKVAANRAKDREASRGCARSWTTGRSAIPADVPQSGGSCAHLPLMQSSV